jgi:sugar phosphate isomerase/epimerase
MSESNFQIRTVRQLWGVTEPWEYAFPKIKKNGYYAVETAPALLSHEEQQRLRSFLNQYDLKLVYQIHTDKYDLGKKDKNIENHLRTFRNEVRNAKEWKAYFINSHTGYDGWNEQERTYFFEKILEIEKEEKVTVSHETHRRRVLFNPWVTRDLLFKFPSLKICADLSHFFCVVHDTLDNEMDIIELIGKHCIHIHARVGYDQGPQVPDPRDPVWLPWLEAHERCWDVIWKAQRASGCQFSHLEPEFGPYPYCHTLPYTNMPVVDIWEVSEWVMKREVERFNKMFPSK